MQAPKVDFDPEIIEEEEGHIVNEVKVVRCDS